VAEKYGTALTQLQIDVFKKVRATCFARSLGVVLSRIISVPISLFCVAYEFMPPITLSFPPFSLSPLSLSHLWMPLFHFLSFSLISSLRQCTRSANLPTDVPISTNSKGPCFCVCVCVCVLCCMCVQPLPRPQFSYALSCKRGTQLNRLLEDSHVVI